MLHEDQPALPWGTVTSDFWAVADAEDDWEDGEAPGYEEPTAFAAAREIPPDGPPSPDDFARRLARLAAPLDRPCTGAELALAALQARLLDQEATAVLGPTDPHTAAARELRGLISRRQGRHADAARWFLHTAGLHVLASGAGDARARASARYALTDWREIQDTAERTAVACEILPMLTTIAGPTAKATAEVEVYLAVQTRK